MKFSEFQTLRSDVNGRTEVNASMLRNDSVLRQSHRLHGKWQLIATNLPL
jgi:hypothetical protein